MMTNLNSDKTNFLATVTNALNSARDAYTNFRGDITNARNLNNNQYLDFLTALTNSRNTARDNYTTFTGNIANSRNGVEQNNLAFLQALANSRANNENAYTSFYGNYTSLANALDQAYASGQMDYYREYGAGVPYADYAGNFDNTAYLDQYNAAKNLLGYTAQQSVYDPVTGQTYGYTPEQVADYVAASTAGINPASLTQGITDAAAAALAAAQGKINTAPLDNVQYGGEVDMSSYIPEIAAMANAYSPVNVEQATVDPNNLQYQRYLQQQELQGRPVANPVGELYMNTVNQRTGESLNDLLRRIGAY